jgi:hypothetical protein
MAVIQISKIQVRRGLNENLPALDSGELGWSVDTRQLYIGNGTIAEGAPTPGVTEILTTYSNGALEVQVQQLEANVANLQSNVITIQSEIASLAPTVVMLSDNIASPANVGITVNPSSTTRVYYNIVRGTNARIGVIKATNLSGTITYDDEYDETANLGVILGFTTYSNVGQLTYVSTYANLTANVTYTIANA